MSDSERRDRHRERDSRREPREGRTGDRERGGTPNERRNRSRSPRRDGGGRRDNRYRSRSPFRRDERDSGGRGGRSRGERGRGRARDDGGRSDYRADRDRAPPTGPRSGAPPPRPNDSRPAHGGPVKPPSGPRSAANVVKDAEESPDVEMREDKEKPEDMDEDTWEMMKTMGFGGFKSTKNTKVPGNDKNFGVRKDKQMEARQYMNRQGGFNRPLSPSRG